jgi:hypothetical protein
LDKIILLNGTARAGKDTFADYVNMVVADDGGIAITVSTVDKIKDAARAFGYNGEKTDAARAFLHELKMASSRFNDFSFNDVVSRVNAFFSLLGGSPGHSLLFIIVREPEDIKKYQDYYRGMAVTVLVTRDEAEGNAPDNYADNGVFDSEYDYIIENNDDLPDLFEAAKFFYANIKKSVDIA